MVEPPLVDAKVYLKTIGMHVHAGDPHPIW